LFADAENIVSGTERGKPTVGSNVVRLDFQIRKSQPVEPAKGKTTMQFEFAHTHAYPGCKVRVTDGNVDTEAVVMFSDGVVTQGKYERQTDSIQLAISSYETARGTRIAEKVWILRPDVKQGHWKVSARLPTQ
jgi:hypothetical protein